MKKQLSVLLTLIMVFLLAVPAWTASAVNYNVKVIVNGKLVDFSGGYGDPYISDENRTMVPVRGTAEAYGCTVEWNEAERQVQVMYGDHYAVIPIGQPYVYTDSGTKQMDTSALIIEGRTYIPIRYTMEAMGAQVDWIENKTLVMITNPDVYITDHDEDTIPENTPSQDVDEPDEPDVPDVTPTYTEEEISDDGSLAVLKSAIRTKGSWDSSMGYVYTMTSSINSSIQCKMVYNTSEDKVYLLSVMLLNDSGSNYMAQQIHVNGSGNGTTSFILRIYSGGADVQAAGHMTKAAYGDPDSYAIDSTSGTSKDMQSSMMTSTVIPYQTALAIECLKSFCSGLSITPASLGFAE